MAAKVEKLIHEIGGKLVTVLLRDGTDVRGVLHEEGDWWILLHIYDDSKLIYDKNGDPINDDEDGVFDNDSFELVHKDQISRIMGKLITRKK